MTCKLTDLWRRNENNTSKKRIFLQKVKIKEHHCVNFPLFDYRRPRLSTVFRSNERGAYNQFDDFLWQMQTSLFVKLCPFSRSADRGYENEFDYFILQCSIFTKFDYLPWQLSICLGHNTRMFIALPIMFIRWSAPR